MKRWAPLLGVGSLALGLALAALVPRPTLDNSVESFLRGADDEAFARYARFLDDFGSDELLILELEGPADRTLALARRFETELATTPGVLAVTGFPTLFAAATDVLLDPELGGFDNLPRLRTQLEGPVNRSLRLFDPKAGRTLSLVTLERASPLERAVLEARLQAMRTEAEEVGLQIRWAGNPLVNLALDQAAKQLEATSLPLLVLTCVLLLGLFTGSLSASAATLAAVGLSVFASEGLLSLAGESTNLIVGISKPLVFVILLASSLHVLVAFEGRRKLGQTHAEAAWGASRDKARPTALALVTTAVGFGAMWTAPVDAMRTFGAVTAATLLLGLALILLGLPFLLSVLGGRPPSGLGRRLARYATRVVTWSAAQRWTIVVAGLVCVLGALCLLGLRPDPHAIRYLATTHPLRQDHEALEAGGRPLSSLELVFTGTSTTLGPQTLEALDRLRAGIDELENVEAVVDATLLLREGQYRASGQDALPDPLFTSQALQTEAARFRPFWHPQAGRLRMSVLIPTLDAAQVRALSARIEGVFALTLGPQSFSLEITGNHALIVAAQDALLETLLRSLLLTTLVLQVVLFIGLGSVRLGFIALLPNVLPVTANFGLMKLSSVPLDVGTSMTAAIALGIAVDDTLHFIASFRETGSLTRTAHETGRALISSSIIIGIGFLVLLPSDFSPTRNFGFLCASAMLTALVGNLVVLPRLLARFAPRTDAASGVAGS